MFKLEDVSKTMSSWSTDNIGNIFVKKNNVYARLTGIQKILETRPTCKHHLDLNEALSSEMNIIYEQEEAFWMTRSSVNWIQCGDQNTSFFQRFVVIRRKRNNITYLESDVGKTIDNKNLVPHIVKFLSDLFTSKIPDPINLHHSHINDISIHYHPCLAEINKAVLDHGPFKAHGIDGIHAHFYQTHWGTIWGYLKSLSSLCFSQVLFLTLSMIPPSS